MDNIGDNGSMKKKFKLLIIALVYLGVCFGIGQYRNYLRNNGDNKNDVMATDGVVMTDKADEIWNSIEFQGVEETSDNPWNFNAGIIDMDGEGKCILLTPNTAVIISVDGVMDKLNFGYEIHPWVKELSDGAELLIQLLDKDGNIIYDEKVMVDSHSEKKSYELSINEYGKVQKIKIVCNNGNQNDDNGDWVVLSK